MCPDAHASLSLHILSHTRRGRYRARVARPLRIQFPGGLYHVTARGNGRLPIFVDDVDCRRFLSVLGGVVARYRLVCHAYCLMGNHYHALLETPDSNLSRAMRQLNGVYAQCFNRRHERSGHVLEGRFHARLVDRDSYLLEVCRYIVLNPVRAGSVNHPREWPWSSYRATAGLVPRPTFLTTSWILSLGHASDLKGAERRYAQFVSAGMERARRQPEPLDPLESQGPLLGPAITGHPRVRQQLERAADLGEIPRAQRHALRPSLEQIFAGVNSREDRDRRSALAVRDHGYTMTAIARYLGRHYITVSRAVARYERTLMDVGM